MHKSNFIDRSSFPWRTKESIHRKPHCGVNLSRCPDPNPFQAKVYSVDVSKRDLLSYYRRAIHTPWTKETLFKKDPSTFLRIRLADNPSTHILLQTHDGAHISYIIPCAYVEQAMDNPNFIDTLVTRLSALPEISSLDQT
jgi:hypothetical protein